MNASEKRQVPSGKAGIGLGVARVRLLRAALRRTRKAQREAKSAAWLRETTDRLLTDFGTVILFPQPALGPDRTTSKKKTKKLSHE